MTVDVVREVASSHLHPMHDRPGATWALEQLHAGHAQFVVCCSLSRFTRRPDEDLVPGLVFGIPSRHWHIMMDRGVLRVGDSESKSDVTAAGSTQAVNHDARASGSGTETPTSSASHCGSASGSSSLTTTTATQAGSSCSRGPSPSPSRGPPPAAARPRLTGCPLPVALCSLSAEEAGSALRPARAVAAACVLGLARYAATHAAMTRLLGKVHMSTSAAAVSVAHSEPKLAAGACDPILAAVQRHLASMLGSRAAGPSREPATGSASSCPQAGRARFVLWARTSVDEHNGASSIPVQLAALQLLAAAVPAACVHVHALEGCSVVHETPALGLVDSLAPGSVILATALDRLLRRPTHLEALCTRAAAKGVRVVLAHASLPVARVVARGWTDAENSERHGEADGSESRACGSTGGGPPLAPPAPSPPLPPPRLQDWVARMAQADQPAAVPCPVLLPTTCVEPLYRALLADSTVDESFLGVFGSDVPPGTTPEGALARHLAALRQAEAEGSSPRSRIGLLHTSVTALNACLADRLDAIRARLTTSQRHYVAPPKAQGRSGSRCRCAPSDVCTTALCPCPCGTCSLTTHRRRYWQTARACASGCACIASGVEGQSQPIGGQIARMQMRVVPKPGPAGEPAAPPFTYDAVVSLGSRGLLYLRGPWRWKRPVARAGTYQGQVCCDTPHSWTTFKGLLESTAGESEGPAWSTCTITLEHLTRALMRGGRFACGAHFSLVEGTLCWSLPVPESIMDGASAAAVPVVHPTDSDADQT